MSFLNDVSSEKNLEQIKADEEAAFLQIMDEMMKNHKEELAAKEAGITLPKKITGNCDGGPNFYGSL